MVVFRVAAFCKSRTMQVACAGTRLVPHRWMAIRNKLVCVTLAGVACSSPVEPEPPLGRVDLRSELDIADASVVGVTVDPDGRRFVFDESAGLFELTATGSIAIMRMVDMPDPGVVVELPYTDAAALGDDQFALTAIGDGFLLDTAENRQSLHFCYEPGFFPEEQRQAAFAVTYDRQRDVIYAQPQTFESGAQEAVSSDVGVYDRASGADIQWYRLPRSDFRAGGMMVAPDGQLVLGSGSSIYRFDVDTSELERLDRLDRYGVTAIEGLAVDMDAGTLLAIDSDSDQLVEILLSDVGM